MPQPGDIIPEANYTHTDNLGRVWFQREETKGYLPPGHLNPKELGPGKKIGPLVHIDQNRYSLNDIDPAAFTKFYCGEKGIQPLALHPEIWTPRWAMAAEQPERVIVEEPPEKMEPPKSPKYRVWRLARSPEWIMPVYSTRYAAQVGPSREFCPASLSAPFFPAYEKGVFSSDEKFAPPLRYRAELTGGIFQKPKPVRIFLHGALEPLKWHTIIRKHLFSGLSTSHSEERGLWESWLNVPFPSAQEAENLYKNCGEDREKDLCLHCAQSQFLSIQRKLQAISDAFWEKLVTFWESQTTKSVEKLEEAFEGNASQPVFEMELTSTGSVKIDHQGRKVKRYPLLVLRGWCYQYDLSGKVAVFHLNVITMYLKKQPQTWESKILPGLEIKNVSRI